MKPSDNLRQAAFNDLKIGDKTYVYMESSVFYELCNKLDMNPATPEKPSFDWSQCPRDTVFEVFVDERWVKRYFSNFRDGIARFYNSGRTSLTNNWLDHVQEDRFRLIHNPPRPWFGGKQPVPDETRVRYKVRVSGADKWLIERAVELYWNWDDQLSDMDIIAYEILGENDENI